MELSKKWDLAISQVPFPSTSIPQSRAMSRLGATEMPPTQMRRSSLCLGALLRSILSKTELPEKIVDSLVGIPLKQISLFGIIDLLEISYELWPHMFRRPKLVRDLGQSFMNKSVPNVRSKLLYQCINATREVADAVVDIPGILLL